MSHLDTAPEGATARETPPTLAPTRSVDDGLLRVREFTEAGALVVALAGEADVSGETLLRETLDRVLVRATESGAPPVVVDLSGLAFCDVRTLTLLLVAHITAVRRGGAVALAGMSEVTERVWQTAFGDTVPGDVSPPTYSTLTAAVDAVGDPASREQDREAARLAAVRRYDLLDTPPDGAFDRVTALAARLFQVPIAIVSIVDEDRIWFASHHGLDLEQVERAPGLCASAILQDGPWLVTDAATDARALANPLVAGSFGLRFYAGVPLTTHDGHNLGTLCVIDYQSREVSAAETSLLTDLATLVVDQLELRLTARRSVDRERRLRVDAQQLSGMLQESLLPAQLPQVPGLDVVTRYHVADRDQVGGDFYDVVANESGCWAMSGDVSGKGTRAAARTAAARWTLRTLTSTVRAPSDALRQLNTLLTQADDDPERSCTIALASIRPRVPDAGVDVTLGLAGHPRPLLLRRDRTVEAMGETAPAIGWLADPVFTDTATTLVPGDVLVLFTDGLVEAVAGHGNPDDIAVRDLLQPLAGQPADAVASRLDDVIGNAVLRDDAAFLVMRAR